MINPQSLKAQLLLKLVVPLIIVVIFDALVSYFVAMHYTDLAYDRWLLDSARSLVQEVRTQKDHVTFDLAPSEDEVFRWDDMDKTFFKVESEFGGFLAGDFDLPSPALTRLGVDGLLYSYGEIDGQEVRVVSVLATPVSNKENVLISVAETLNKRRSMMHEILLASVLPQILLVLFTGILLWLGANRVLDPLNDLAGHLARRSAKDFKPIPDAGVPLEARALTHTINALLERLGDTLITQQRFVENAAHQLRTPLAGLKVQAERALHASDPNATKFALAHIKNAADRVAHLSAQLLALARSDALAHSSSEFSSIDLNKLSRECCMEWAPRALERNMELGFDSSDTAVPVAADETLLRELLGNLLDNAVSYGKPGGRIGVSVQESPHAALIVEDDGPGIPAHEHERVFERFYRIQGSPGEGCGLGLSIVREIADRHNARITLTSAMIEGTGARIEVAFIGRDGKPSLAPNERFVKA